MWYMPRHLRYDFVNIWDLKHFSKIICLINLDKYIFYQPKYITILPSSDTYIQSLNPLCFHFYSLPLELGKLILILRTSKYIQSLKIYLAAIPHVSSICLSGLYKIEHKYITYVYSKDITGLYKIERKDITYLNYFSKLPQRE